VDTPHRRGSVRAGLGPVQERTQVVDQVSFVILEGLPVDARGTILARAPEGLQQQTQVEVVVERGKRHLLVLLCKLCYPL